MEEKIDQMTSWSVFRYLMHKKWTIQKMAEGSAKIEVKLRKLKFFFTIILPVAMVPL